MRLVFVHGWSVTNTNTYGELPQALAKNAQRYNLDLDIQHLYLGRYISFHDEVTVDDIARSMDQALHDLEENRDGSIQPFSCITHSTGGPVVRHWIDKFYGADRLNDLPLRHLIMLAPANHGSTLAKLGKARVGRINSWFQGVEPGQRVLDWLALGSDGQWTLNERYLTYDYGSHDFYPFVLTGQGIDRKFYDFLNNYLVEEGSDGVVRVAGANMNYRYFSLVQNREIIVRKKPLTYALKSEQSMRYPHHMPLAVYKNYSHSGSKMGIMRSIKEADGNAPIVNDILKCLRIDNRQDYDSIAKAFSESTKEQQKDDKRFCMLVFNIRNDQGEQIGMDDYDLFLLAGKNYSPQALPSGFFKDRQMNDKTGRLIYYLDANKMGNIKDGRFGLRVVARPSAGFSYYCAAEYRSDGIDAGSILAPNETTYVDIKLHRFVDQNVFRFDPAENGAVNFKKITSSGTPINSK